MHPAQPPAVHTDQSSYRVLMVLPPDFASPPSHRRHRFPHQGPALVAAAIRADGVDTRAVDLELELHERPLTHDHELLEDDEKLRRHLKGEHDEALIAIAGEMIDRFGDVDVDAFAISIDRHTQIKVSVLLGVELKRRFGRPVIIGGGNSGAAVELLNALAAKGVDVITAAVTPDEIRVAFRALRDVPRNRWEASVEPVRQAIATAPDDWPVPDFSIYDLGRFRRDPFHADGSKYFPRYDGRIGRALFLPYHFTWDCQYSCAFCQRGGKQTVKSPERVVRDLATLAERYDCRDFMFFDAQINLHAEAVSQAMIAAKLDVHWSDSIRVAPRRPANGYETMAKAGCVGLTYGVESASDRMLKRMIKGHTAAQATKAIRDAHALEIMVRVNLLPCFPGETREDFELTREWVRENAFAIDDIAPSSFYLADGSPVGQNASKFGILVRGVRELQGDHKFRKNLGSLAFDEIGGYTWEQREPMLRAAEEELRLAWRDGRRGIGVSCSQPSQAFALRRRFATKREAYAAMLEWTRTGNGSLQSTEVALLGRALSGASGLGQHSPDAPNASPEVPMAELPAGSARARALEAVRAIAKADAVEVTAPDAGPARFMLELKGSTAGCRIHLERLREGVKFFKRGKRVVLWYSTDRGAPEAAWMRTLLPRAAEVLVSDAFDAIADELGEATAPGKVTTFPPVSVIDMVRQGLKPAASVLVSSEADPLSGVDDLPAFTLSRISFRQDERENLVPERFPRAGKGRRMLYVGRDRASVERLRDIEELLYMRGVEQLPAGVDPRELQDEFGRLMGYPACCTRAFAETYRAPTGAADFYTSLVRLGWDLKPVDWRVNHIVAHLYQLPFLIHVPCGEGCASTLEGTQAAVERVYPEGAKELVTDVLHHGAIVWPDDRIVLFRPEGAPADGELAVTSFNRDPHPQVMRHPRAPERTFVRDAGGFRDEAVSRIRVRGAFLEAYADGAWRPYPAGAPESATLKPLVLVTMARPADAREPRPARVG